MQQTASTTPALRTVLFDLDGTLADTAPDIAFALNRLLEERGKTPLPFESIRPAVSHGTGALVSLAFSVDAADPDFSLLRERFLAVYQSRLAVDTRLFPGMAELLEDLTADGRNWGVVTNKPGRLTLPLMERLGLNRKAACIISGDTTDYRKPHPAPMLLACDQTGSRPAQCLYVGDARRDIEAGRRAGMHTLVALYGYLGDGDVPAEWGADAVIEHPAAILEWIRDREAAAITGPPPGHG